MLKLYENIRTRRLALHMSQQRLAELTGYADKSMIAKIEKGLVDIPHSKLELFAKALRTKPGDLMGPTEEELPPNVYQVLPGQPIPILGIVCAGDGKYCEDRFLGSFVCDKRIGADFVLVVEGDSMIGANIYDGDYAFIRKDYDFEEGKIYAVEMLDSGEAFLKKVYINGDSAVLAPCNPDYSPIITTVGNIRIIGRCVGIYQER